MNLKVTVLALTAMLIGASTAAAATITIKTDAGTTYTTDGINDVADRSTQMNGMEVTALWTVNGTNHSAKAIWSSGVTFTGFNFDLDVNGDTINSTWKLDFSLVGDGRLQSLEFNGVPGHTVFDGLFNGLPGTPGSGPGKDVSGFDDYDGNITATYFNQVILGSNNAVGDVYAGLRLDFNSSGGLGQSVNWRFSLDSDIANTSLAPSTTAAAPVPEPASMLLFGTGLVTLAGVARRRLAARRA